MTRRFSARNPGNSGRVNVAGSELGDEVDADVADTKEVAHAIIDRKDVNHLLIATPR